MQYLLQLLKLITITTLLALHHPICLRQQTLHRQTACTAIYYTKQSTAPPSTIRIEYYSSPFEAPFLPYQQSYLYP